MNSPVPLTSPARYGFDSDQLALIKRTVARGADDNALLMFLELVGRYRLDPFAKQVYLAQMPGRDGEGGSYATIVSRDGLLAIANRSGDFLGLEGDVVREGDMLARTPEGFLHTYEAVEAAERMKRPVIGGWARALRQGRVPTFFFAPFSQYVRGNKPWRQYPDAMILKVAESMALRKAFSITGLIPEDEIGAELTASGGLVADGVVEEPEPDLGADPEFAAYLRALFEEANRVRPGSFRPQKVRLQLAGADDGRRREIAAEVERFVLRNGGALPGSETPMQTAAP